MTTQRLASSLKAWEAALVVDNDLNYFVIGEVMAQAIREFLEETEAAERDRHKNLDPSDSLLKSLDYHFQEQEKDHKEHHAAIADRLMRRTKWIQQRINARDEAQDWSGLR